MWVGSLDEAQVRAVLGENGAAILRLLREGHNEEAVRLFLDSWGGIPWRENEGTLGDSTASVLAVRSYNDALNPTASKRWQQALLDAGYRSDDPVLDRVWTAGSRVGNEIGGHHAGFIAAAAAGELAQTPARDLHFFLELMPWVRAGHWPCGWDDAGSRPKIF